MSNPDNNKITEADLKTVPPFNLSSVSSWQRACIEMIEEAMASGNADLVRLVILDQLRFAYRKGFSSGVTSGLDRANEQSGGM